MKRLRGLVILMMASVLIACTTTPERQTSDEKLARINLELGVAYMREGNNVQALEKLTKAMNLDPNDAKIHATLGLLHSRLGQNKQADEHFQAAVKLDANDSAIRNNYGAFLCQQKRFDEAEAQFQKAIANPLYNTPEYAYTNAGVCMLNNNDLDKAEQYFRTALRVNPKFSPALLQMAQISFDKERYLPTRAYLQRYAEVASHNPQSLWLSVRTEHKLGDRNTAASHALQLKAKFPDAEETRQLLKWEQNEQSRR